MWSRAPSLILCIAALPAYASPLHAGPWPWIDDASGANELSVLLMGDTNLQGREDPAEAYRYVRETLLAADVRFANLECALAGSSKDPLIDDIPHKRWIHSEPDQVAALESVRMSAVGVANNVNYPWQAMLRSIAVLDSAGIAHTGGGNNSEAARRPAIIRIRNTRVGFIQYAATVFPFNHAASDTRPGIAAIRVSTAYQPPPNLDKPGQPPIVITRVDDASMAAMRADIEALAGVADVVVASYHWGISNSTDVIDYQRVLGRAAIDAGADVVLGHGPHTYQEIEMHRGRPIFHSTGQFVFDDRLRLGKHEEGLLVRLLVRDGQVAGISLVPSWRDESNLVRLHSPNSDKGRELLGYLRSVNGAGGAELEVAGDEIVIRGLVPRSANKKAK